MGRLDDYRTAMLVADPAVSTDVLNRALDAARPDFDLLVVSHGLGPLWHTRTGRREFHQSRMNCEALYLAQHAALQEVHTALTKEGVAYAVIKGAALREAIYDVPALRTCHDIDLLCHPDDRLQAASLLTDIGFEAAPLARSISRELVLSRNDVDIDLHWALLREGRLRNEDVPGILSRRDMTGGVFVPSAEDTLFLLLVHPPFAKHLAGWDMGLHRVVDIVNFLTVIQFDWGRVRSALVENGVSSAAWATLRWTQMLTYPQPLPLLEEMLAELRPGSAKAWWLEHWLESDLSARFSGRHWMRLLGFSPLLHDEPGDVYRAFAGRRQARKRSKQDSEVFADLIR